MGFLGLLKRKKTETKEKDYIPKSDKKSSRQQTAPADQLSFLVDNCELISESDRQIEEAKVEYQAVTSYLTDMQRIDMSLKEQREKLEEAARNIYNLTRERNLFQQKNTILTDRQYRLFERYEMQLPRELPEIKEREEYQDKIHRDMEFLEKEKNALAAEQEDIISKQGYLKWIAITTSIIVVFLFIIFALLENYSEANLSIPFLLTVLMGMASSLYIFMEARKNTYAIQFVQAKQKRQIMLMNKVKIKSVNNLNFLEYTYNKYTVDNYDKLKALWEEYIVLKEEARKYQTNTQMLNFYNNELMKELKEIGVSDSEIWIYQPSAIIDSKEMVEVRHRLNVRRQKLRDRIDTIMKQKEESLEVIKSTIKENPESAQEANLILKRYGIPEIE
ncbi:MAG TPA: hypothetical protein DEG06_10215 [Lachnospiraceae bacterium]|jgi:uncharacterized integral membrane protein|nr:hypothetical protein [Lachnospiraceae bacterium]HBY72600.1 hypothetical protein [Lachnospiraceae bacterium]HCA69737.1 hypothetical protein [Lachnospiraceae bacterium]HCM12848.1 hypothetical protein [Lachnospiraceae bacterium]HCR41118.1 hypothetical protein [Lachnospiraceae bacterium]